jgi:CubicO group peptidase (beta-lactamase class C family)
MAVCACLVFSAPSARAEGPAPDFGEVEARMQELVLGGRLPSISAAAVDGGRLVWMRSAGWADREAGLPATPDTIYRIGSVSKAITATVAALAIRDGSPGFSESICVGAPGLTQDCAITIADAFNMTAGLQQAVRYSGIDGARSSDSAEAFLNQHAISITGVSNRYDYSNMGPALAVRAIERSTHQQFPALARRMLFEPLALSSTFYTMRDAPAPHRAASYRRNLSRFEHEFEIDPSVSAGMVSSLRDLVQFARLHLGVAETSVLNAAELQNLHQPGRTGFYGFGWGRIAADGSEFLVSDGQVNGGQAVLLLQPLRGMAVVVVANVASEHVNRIALQILDALHPGAASAFEVGVAAVEASLVREAPHLSDGRRQSVLTVGGRRLRLNLLVLGAEVELSTSSRSVRGLALAPESGYLRWAIPCLSELPACVPGRDAEATLMLIEQPNGVVGLIAVSSSLGLFPYAIDLE